MTQIAANARFSLAKTTGRKKESPAFSMYFLKRQKEKVPKAPFPLLLLNGFRCLLSLILIDIKTGLLMFVVVDGDKDQVDIVD